MRWWLAAAFAVVAAITAVAVVGVLNGRSEHAFRRYAEDLAVGTAVSAAESLQHEHTLAALQAREASFSSNHRLALFAFDTHGRLLTASTSNQTTWDTVPDRDRAVRAVLNHNRFIAGAKDGSAIVVGLGIHGGPARGLVAYSLRPELKTQLGIVRNEFFKSALIAFVLGAAAGLLVAAFTGRRLKRIADAARAIGGGDFSVRVADRFPDEVGSLAGSLEEMRVQLQGVFEVLRDDRNRLESLLDRLDEGVVLIRRDLTVEFANGRARDLLGSDLTTSKLAQDIQRFVIDVFASEIPAQLRLAADDERTLLISGIPPGAGAETVIVVLTDESQRERAERAQREFATNAAHELRTPLASIVTAIEMLQTGAKDDSGARDDFLRVIETEAARLTRLTHALLILARAEARQESPRLASLELASVLERVVAAVPHPGVEIAVDCPPELVVAADRDLLEQALSNLVANAVRHGAGDAVVLRAGVAPDGRVNVDVVDRGRGIAPADQARIFERFYRAGDAEDGGFGLGLPIARDAVQALGGTIEVLSRPGEGTTVRVSLPTGRPVEVA
jgi:signal transduction histidine kinase